MILVVCASTVSNNQRRLFLGLACRLVSGGQVLLDTKKVLRADESTSTFQTQFEIICFFGCCGWLALLLLFAVSKLFEVPRAGRLP